MNFITRSLSRKLSVMLAVPLSILLAVAATAIILQQTEALREQTLDKARVAARIGAQFYGEALEDAIDDGVLTVGEVFDTDYVQIQGYDFGAHPKFHTDYDFYTDHTVLRFQDEFLVNPDFVFALGQDRNGYIPTHNTRYQKPLTGDAQIDLVGNRSKRIFDDPVGLAAGKNQERTLVQVYNRDTGETMWDVSAPILVKGKHWGGFRLAVSMERVEARTASLFYLLVGSFALLGLIALGIVMAAVRQALGPIKRLTQAADLMSMGEGLDDVIEVRTNDEVGRLAQSIERLRLSMKSALNRLGV